MSGKKDLRLVYTYDLDSRMSHSKIGKKIRMSQQLVNYKIKSFQEKEIILSAYPLIDYARFGYINFIVYFKINYMNKERFLDLIDKLWKENDIVELTECGGRYDLISVFSSKNPSSFNKKLKELILRYPNQLKNYLILTTVVSYYLPKSYLIKEDKNKQYIVIGGDREISEITETDKKILFHLVQDCSKTIFDISKVVNVDPKTVINRIKKMRESEIIRGFKPLFDMQSLNVQTNKILLKYHNLSVEKEQELVDFCIRNPNITEITKVFGEWDLELTVETMEQKDFRSLYIILNEKFQDIIQDFDRFHVFKTHKKTCLPQSFFE
ncbi:MAG: Lrp/AsnC family transcriptional regulator [Candidatus Aenigmatarchaeota archaeon]